jgi:hypothetical protein
VASNFATDNCEGGATTGPRQSLEGHVMHEIEPIPDPAFDAAVVRAIEAAALATVATAPKAALWWAGLAAALRADPALLRGDVP